MALKFQFQSPFRPLIGSSHLRDALLAALSPGPCQIPIRAGSIAARERRRHDPFLMAQSRQRKAANLSRQRTLRESREAALGDPVRSKSTPFIEELQGLQGLQQPLAEVSMGDNATSLSNSLNYFVSPNELSEALEYSKRLTSPVESLKPSVADPQREEETGDEHLDAHQRAQESISRIASLANGNTKDRTRVNIQKCIGAFGRHYTDGFLPPKPAAASPASAPVQPERAPRAGPDTGSPEVQIAILTTKIMNLTRHLETTNKDKHNKRNLRLLVHKRQKLLRYLRRKERGGPRWQHLVESLGLSDGAWTGEISM